MCDGVVLDPVDIGYQVRARAVIRPLAEALAKPVDQRCEPEERGQEVKACPPLFRERAPSSNVLQGTAKLRGKGSNIRHPPAPVMVTELDGAIQRMQRTSHDPEERHVPAVRRIQFSE